MDTKWRSKTRFILFALLLVIGLSGPLTLLNQGSYYLQRDYFSTQEFRQELNQFSSHLSLFELNSLSQQEAKTSITVEKDEIVNYRNQFGSLTNQVNSIHDEYETLIQDARAGNNNTVANFYAAQRDSKVEDLMKLFQDDESAIAQIRKEKEHKIDRYYRLREQYRPEYNRLLDEFDYYIRNTSKGKVHSNMNVEGERPARNKLSDRGYVYATDYTIDTTNSLHSSIEGHELLAASFSPYQGWIAVSKDSPLQEAAKRYRWEQLILFAYVLTSSVLLVVSLTRFKSIMSTRDEASWWAIGYRKLPLDVKMLFISGTAALTVSLLSNFASYYPSVYDIPLIYGGKLLVSLTIAAISMALTLLQGKLLVNGLRSWNEVGKEWSHSLLHRSGSRVKASFVQTMNQFKDSFIYKSTGIRLSLFTIIFIGSGFIGGWAAFTNNDTLYALLALTTAIGIAAFFLLFRQLGYLNRIAKAADELAAGRMPDALPQSGSGVITSLAININALRQGVSMLQNEQAKSERLKTELITNVSHDLRTPLTSIITYTELLKSEEVTMEERAAYVEIIDQKSKRLKTMIDDLFEVSTMTSGNANLLLQKTDLVQLMQQAVGEHKEAMDNSDVQFRISLPEYPIYSPADGQKLWRVFDNLIGNMLKYSLNHTRAYISMQLSEQKVTITFKNVSNYEINDNAEELFERFKRGDTSRHTEGSGLGLAIAKTIVDLHEGRLILETDGDLFKASVILKVEEASVGI
ncbi:sensor histidine kinase [Paenibacillus herberti]|uniref:histidine kinase n=1 Tax=Paenibacillus herberti TaxID=1619309 RepID=A0A229P403_9BACL|nr:HAMP domain-containing sensor histidine kinase [Paenibacillus herberti]OXM17016.1 sensor histidine kinase [Paenibacillus herberti]